MTPLRVLVLCMLFFVVSGCTSVDSPRPIGESPVSISAQDWEGTWQVNDGVIFLRVVDAAQGKLKMAMVDADDEGDLILKKFGIEIRKTGDWVFANIQNAEHPGRFHWMRVKNEEHRIVVWAPDMAKIKALVDDGTLPGTIGDDGNIHLNTLSEEQMKRLTSEDKGNLYSWENPGFFRRLSPGK